MRLIAITVMLLTSACSSHSSFEWEDTGSNDTIELYRSIERPHGISKGVRLLGSNSTDLYGYSRTEADALATRFPVLNNPTFALYVFPHINKDNIPIPGYITTFKLYQGDIFALPGER